MAEREGVRFRSQRFKTLGKNAIEIRRNALVVASKRSDIHFGTTAFVRRRPCFMKRCFWVYVKVPLTRQACVKILQTFPAGRHIAMAYAVLKEAEYRCPINRFTPCEHLFVRNGVTKRFFGGRVARGESSR